MRKPTKSEKIGIASVLLLALSVVGYVFLYNYIMNLHTTLNDVNIELASAVQIVENKQATLSLLEETAGGRIELQKHFVSIDDPTQFLNLIDTIATDVGVVSESEKVEIVEVENILKRYPAELQKRAEVVLLVEGRWDDIYRFISLLELFPYVVTIDRVALKYDIEGENGPWGGQIHIHSKAM